MSLRERAERAYQEAVIAGEAERREREAKELAARAATLKRLLLRALGIEADPRSDRIEIDGLSFGLKRERYGSYDSDELSLIRPCERCGAPVWSCDIDGLVTLGWVLQREPICRFGCPPEEDEDEDDFANTDTPPSPVAVEPTAAEQLSNAVIALLREQGVLS